MLAALIFSAGAQAQCYVNFNYSQNAGTTAVAFNIDSLIDSGSGLLGSPTLLWNMGDGTSDSGTSFTHTYAAPGVYVVCVTMSDAVTHCNVTQCDTIVVDSPSIRGCGTVIDFNHTDSLFSFSTSNYGVAPFTYNWTRGGVAFSTDPSPTAIIGGSLVEVCVSVTDSTGCIAYNCVYVIDSATAPACSAYIGYTHTDSLYTFTASLLGTTPASYLWTYLGVPVDSNTTFSMVINSPAAGTAATVCLDVTTASGCHADNCVTIIDTTGMAACQAYFALYPDTAAGDSTYYGYNLSTGSYGSNILWSFGDGSTSTSPFPSHTYAAPGFYIVCLSVGTPGTSCYSTYCDSSFYVVRALMPMGVLNILPPAGIKNVASGAGIEIYPNPANSELNIQSAARIDQARITAADGQLVYSSRSSATKINISGFAPGIYILELSSAGQVTRLKFAKD